MRLFLAALLVAVQPLQALAQTPDVLTTLFHDLHSDAPPSTPDGVQGRRLAAIASDIRLATQGLEAFRSTDDSRRALAAAPERVPSELRPRFKDRATALDTLYRTLAISDYTFASRESEEDCSARARRARLLDSPDGLFKDPASGKASPWLIELLGSNALDGAEKALDEASASFPADEHGYESLRGRIAELSSLLGGGETTSGRAHLFCERAAAYEKLAAANRSAAGPIAAARATPRTAHGVILIGRRVGDAFEVAGAGAAVPTSAGPRAITDATVVAERASGEKFLAAWPDARAFAPVTVERDESGLALLSVPGLDDALAFAEEDPRKGDLVAVVAHSDRLGAWARTQGLVSRVDDGMFQTDAVVDSAQSGGVVLDESGRLAGLLVLRQATAPDGEGLWPVAVPASRLKSWLAGRPLETAARPIALADAGSTAILTDMHSLADSLRPGSSATEAGDVFVYSQTQYGTVRGKCMAHCGGGAPSATSSYTPSYGNAAVAEGGAALGQAMALGIQALLFRGIPALFRAMGGLFKPSENGSSGSSSYAAPAPKPAPLPPPPPPKKKEPLHPSGMTLTLDRDQAYPGDSVTMTASVAFTGEVGSKSGLRVQFLVPNARLSCGACTASTDSDGVAALTATVLKLAEDEPRKTAAYAASAQDDLDRETAAHQDTDAESSSSEPQPVNPDHVEAALPTTSESNGKTALGQPVTINAGFGAISAPSKDMTILITRCPPGSIAANAYGQGAVPGPGHPGTPPSKEDLDRLRRCDELEKQAAASCANLDGICRDKALRNLGYDFSWCRHPVLPSTAGPLGGTPASIGGIRPFQYVKCVRNTNSSSNGKAPGVTDGERGWQRKAQSEASSEGENSRPRGLAPDGITPPGYDNRWEIRAPSRPSELSKGGKSYWDPHGGEWRYFPEDKYHYPHWDYNPHDTSNSPWSNIPLKPGMTIMKDL